MEEFSIWNSQTFDVSSLTVVAGEPMILVSSPNQVNTPIKTSLLLQIEYEVITPDITVGSPPFLLTSIVEALDANSKWIPIAYQFASIRSSENPSKRIIRLQPDMVNFSPGTDDSIFILDREVARVSRQQSRLLASNWRLSLMLLDRDPTGPNKFISVKVSAAGVRYGNPQT